MFHNRIPPSASVNIGSTILSPQPRRFYLHLLIWHGRVAFRFTLICQVNGTEKWTTAAALSTRRANCALAFRIIGPIERAIRARGNYFGGLICLEIRTQGSSNGYQKFSIALHYNYRNKIFESVNELQKIH